MAEPFLGEIKAIGFGFPPRGWALCDGQLLPISSNSALFSLLGTTYGGDGRTNFALPDLRGRVPVHPGNGAGVNPVSWGQRFGASNHNLSVNQLPPHTHRSRAATGGEADRTTPAGNYPAEAAAYSSAGGGAAEAGDTGSTGSGAAFGLAQPSLGIYYVIALVGIYPSRS